MLATDADEAMGAILWLLRRRWGIAACREAARLTLDRLEYVGGGAEAAVRRRNEERQHASAAREAACWHMHGLRAGHMRRVR